MQLALSAVVLLGGGILAYTRLDELKPESALCQAGLCGPSVKTVTTERVNPFAWSDLAEERAAAGDIAGAREAFATSVRLGPHIPPILIRVVNFEVGNGELERVIPELRHSLELTGAYDNVVHRYLLRSEIPMSRILNQVIPDPGKGSAEELNRRTKAGGHHASAPDGEGRPKGDAARSWVSYLIADRRPESAEAYAWLDARGGITPPLRNQWIDYLIGIRKDYSKAIEVWAAAHPGEGYPGKNRIFNSKFQQERTGSRLDWTISAHPHVAVRPGDGLTLRFDGAENVAYGHVSQQTYVPAGRWRFVADIVADGLTTDQRPFFRIYDATDVRRLDVVTPMAPEKMQVEYTVPPGGSWVVITLQRSQSGKFDNKIQGSLKLREVRMEAAYGGN